MDETPITITLTDEQIIEDTATRMKAFRDGMHDLIQRTNIFPDVAFQESNHQVGLVLKDKVHGRPDLNEPSRQRALKEHQDVADAMPIPEPTPEEAAALAEFLEGEGDPIPPAHEEPETPEAESSAS